MWSYLSSVAVKRVNAISIPDSGRSAEAASGRHLPDTDLCWKLDRELALSAATGRSNENNVDHKAAAHGAR
jgi:hypothetical protein